MRGKDFSPQEIQAMIRIQSTIRGILHRKKQAIRHAQDVDMTYEPTWLVGNDPKIEGLSQYAAPTGQVALVGTSGLRSLGLICELANKENVPKLIIVDNSNKVVRFWRQLRSLAEMSAPENFQTLFEAFLKDNASLYRTLPEISRAAVQYEQQDPVDYMNHLIAQNGLDYVLSIIKNAIVIGQLWSEPSLFIALRNILKSHGIKKTYIYPSNIEAFVDDVTKAQVAANIKLFKPYLSISTNLEYGLPTKVFFSTAETLKLSQPSQHSLDNDKKIGQKIDEKSYYNSIEAMGYLNQNIQELLIDLVSHIDIRNDRILSSDAKVILNNMNSGIKALAAKTRTYSDKQKNMITLFLGGIIFAMVIDDNKYHYRCDHEFKKHIVHLVSSLRELPISDLLSNLNYKSRIGEDSDFLHEVGHKALKTWSGAFIWTLFSQKLNFGTNIAPRTFLPSLLPSHEAKLALLLNFCEKHGDDLEIPLFEVNPVVTKLTDLPASPSLF